MLKWICLIVINDIGVSTVHSDNESDSNDESSGESDCSDSYSDSNSDTDNDSSEGDSKSISDCTSDHSEQTFSIRETNFEQVIKNLILLIL